MTKNKIFNEETLEYLNKNRSLPSVYSFKYNSYDFIGLNSVFAPKLFEDTAFFSDEIEVKKGDRFLEIGCGTGVISIVKAMQGAIVTSCDINHDALKNTKMNAILNNVDKSVNVFYSDVFDNIDDVNTFDIIFWNMPFIYSEEKENNILNTSCFSYKYKNIEKFIMESEILVENGKQVIFGFSNDSGSSTILDSIIDKVNLKRFLLKERKLSLDNEPSFSVGLYILKVK